jgi:hypothetical protein
MIAFLFYLLLLFVVLPWLFKRMFPPVLIEPPPPAVTVLTPSIVIHVHVTVCCEQRNNAG